jgi:hypothetical protein
MRRRFEHRGFARKPWQGCPSRLRCSIRRRGLSSVSSRDEWPFGMGEFDVVVSKPGWWTADLDHFLRQYSRVLAVEGFAVYVFPLEQ